MRRLLLLPLLLALALLAPGAAHAADSHAPKGARLDWLPKSEWVMSSWLPFDEARLHQLVHTDRDELRAWLDDHRTILQLARAHGVDDDATTLARKLVTRKRLFAAGRARDVLTQAHLSRHVLFHVFHTPAIPDGARAVFGVTPRTFRRLRDSGMSPTAIALRGGRTVAEVKPRLLDLLARRGRAAARSGAMSPAQAAALLDVQREEVDAYLSHRFRTPGQQVAFLCRPV